MAISFAPLLQLRNIHLSYRDLPVLKGVDFDLYTGEIHAIAGEHRSGKSSLIKLLSGDIKKQRGTIILKGNEIEYFTPQSAIKHGIGIVYQQVNIIPSLNAVENIYAGRMPAFWLLSRTNRKRKSKCLEIFERLDTAIDLRVQVGKLSIGEQQMVELARVLSLEPQIIILDEISSRLNPKEMENLFRILKEYREQGRAIIYVSPNVDEVFKIADRVTVLKDGHRRGTELVKELDRFKLIRLAYSLVLNIEDIPKEDRQLFFLKQYNEDLISNLPVGIIIIDPENKLHISNHAARKILALDEQNLGGQSVEELFSITKVSKHKEILSKILNRERYAWEGITVGNEKFIKLKTFPLRNVDYIFLGTILMIEDVSMDYFVKEYLLRAEKIESIAELASGVAHEINNPLGIIQNYVELLKLKKIDTDGKDMLIR
ncbi:MAG: ATP-binding cassette domain-containing protein, partial [Spirochaetota bacterium]